MRATINSNNIYKNVTVSITILVKLMLILWSVRFIHACFLYPHLVIPISNMK